MMMGHPPPMMPPGFVPPGYLMWGFHRRARLPVSEAGCAMSLDRWDA